jgi:soluble P-type ATPase
MSSESTGLLLQLPGAEPRLFRHLLLDFNGTLAEDGQLLDGVTQPLCVLAKKLEIHVITADTHGSARDQLAALPVKLHVLGHENQTRAKAEFLLSLDGACVAVGNGRNDTEMLRLAGLGIALIEPEALSRHTLENADLICLNIYRALELLLKPARLVASLREA